MRILGESHAIGKQKKNKIKKSRFLDDVSHESSPTFVFLGLGNLLLDIRDLIEDTHGYLGCKSTLSAKILNFNAADDSCLTFRDVIKIQNI